MLLIDSETNLFLLHKRQLLISVKTNLKWRFSPDTTDWLRNVVFSTIQTSLSYAKSGNLTKTDWNWGFSFDASNWLRNELFYSTTVNYTWSANLSENGLKMTIFAWNLELTEKRIFFYYASLISAQRNWRFRFIRRIYSGAQCWPVSNF